MDIVNRISDYEAGMLDYDETLKLFQDLVDTGIIYSLQGHYGRTAHAMIESGEIVPA